ncbi:MAG: M23 family metallopeptidase [Deinococcales bacterium]
MNRLSVILLFILPMILMQGFAQELYTVKRNDTLFAIAKKYDVEVGDIQSANQLNGSTIYEGQRLAIPLASPELLMREGSSGFYVSLQPQENMLQLALKYGMPVSELMAANNITNINSVVVGQKIFVPMPQGGYIPEEPVPQVMRNQQLLALRQAGDLLKNFEPPSQRFAWPLKNQGRITSNFGYRNLAITQSNYHYGVDLAAPLGTDILAARAGIVSEARWIGGYGNVVYVNHNDGTQTRYAHMSQINVTAGQQVLQGTVLGKVGSTGVSTGPHLHFELRIGGYAVDPLGFLEKN